MSQMEKNYKQLNIESGELSKKDELVFDQNGNLMETTENMEALKVRGTKSLMENLQTLMKGGQMIKDAEIIDNDDLINPKTKFGTNSSDLLGGDGDDDFEIEDDIYQ